MYVLYCTYCTRLCVSSQATYDMYNYNAAYPILCMYIEPFPIVRLRKAFARFQDNEFQITMYPLSLKYIEDHFQGLFIITAKKEALYIYMYNLSSIMPRMYHSSSPTVPCICLYSYVPTCLHLLPYPFLTQSCLLHNRGRTKEEEESKAGAIISIRLTTYHT